MYNGFDWVERVGERKEVKRGVFGKY